MKNKILIITILFSTVFSCTKDPIISNTLDKNLNRQTTGSSANDILSASKFKSILIELVYVEGFEPTQTAINNFISFLENRTYKPQGITIRKRQIPSPGKAIYTIEDISNIEKEHRQYYNSENEIAIWAYFSDGKSSSDSEQNNTVVLGTAYWNTSFVIFEKTVQDYSNGPLQPNQSLLETTVINHEFGHIFGLTNFGSAMQSNHEDTTHPKHCNVESCLMYWNTVSLGNLANLNSIPQLDSQCIADLQANGGK